MPFERPHLGNVRDDSLDVNHFGQILKLLLSFVDECSRLFDLREGFLKIFEIRVLGIGTANQFLKTTRWGVSYQALQ